MVEIPVNGNGLLELPRWEAPVSDPTDASLQESTLDPDTGITLGEMGRTMIRVERKLDTSMEEIHRKIDVSMKSIETKFDDAHKDHEARLRALERWMWGAVGSGAAGFVSGMAALFSSYR